MEPHTPFQRYCRQWSADITQIDDQNGRIAYFRKALPQLLLDAPVVRSILKHISSGDRWPDIRRTGLFRHEILLYLDAGRRFSVRLYFHPPHAHTEIHDHTSWGISGTPFGTLSVIRYTHSGIAPDGTVELRRSRQNLLSPGQVAYTRPWNDGIHQTGGGDQALNVMISVYGPPGRRLYVNFYDEQTGRVTRRYPPRLAYRNWAQSALRHYEKHLPQR